MQTLDQGFEDAIIALALPSKYRKVLRTSNMIERENAEIRRRERVIQIFPNKESALRLLGAVLMDHNNEWQMGRVFIMEYRHKPTANGVIRVQITPKSAQTHCKWCNARPDYTEIGTTPKQVV